MVGSAPKRRPLVPCVGAQGQIGWSIELLCKNGRQYAIFPGECSSSIRILGFESGEIGFGSHQIALENRSQNDSCLDLCGSRFRTGVDEIGTTVREESIPNELRGAEFAALKKNVAEQKQTFIGGPGDEILIDQLPKSCW